VGGWGEKPKRGQRLPEELRLAAPVKSDNQLFMAREWGVGGGGVGRWSRLWGRCKSGIRGELEGGGGPLEKRVARKVGKGISRMGSREASVEAVAGGRIGLGRIDSGMRGRRFCREGREGGCEAVTKGQEERRGVGTGSGAGTVCEVEGRKGRNGHGAITL